MNQSMVLTGDRPTGQLHLGHYVGSLTQRLTLQNQYPLFVLIADTQVLNNDVIKGSHVKENILSLMRSYLACGLDPQKVIFILQSRVPALFELTQYLSNLVSLSLVMRNPTIKTENKLYNDNEQLNMGFLNYPIAQTADVILFGANLVPVGEDQVPILQFANDVIDKFHYQFNTSMFKTIEPLLSHYPRLIGIDGVNKMAKSLNNAIFLFDDEKSLKEKINKMYTDPGHIRVSDPGQVQGNVVFSFLDVFMRDKQHLEALKEHYKKGGLGDVTLKKLLFEEINIILKPIKEKEFAYSDKELLDILQSGTSYANIIAQDNMEKIRDVIFR